MKSIAPMWSRLRHVQRPHMFMVRSRGQSEADQPSTGQRMAELVAFGVGSWWFLGIQAFLLLLWLLYNTIQFTTHFDPPPYILLNLLLSFQAAFTGPVLLIAANVGAMRDHKQADRIEGLAKQNEDLTDQNRQLAERMIGLEQMLEVHVAQSLQTHAMELRDLGVLMRDMHATICQTPASDGAGVQLQGPAPEADTPPTGETLVAASPPEPAAEEKVGEQPSSLPARTRGRPAGDRSPRRTKGG